MSGGMLVDTSVLMRSSDSGAAEHRLAVGALARLLRAGSAPCVTAQNIIEFWAVATRPPDANGFAWTSRDAQAACDRILRDFAFVEDTAAVFDNWQVLVRRHSVSGKRSHDARLVAVMLANGLTHLLTFNTDHFRSFAEITAVHPREIVAEVS